MDRRAAKARLNRLDTIDDVRRAARRSCREVSSSTSIAAPSRSSRSPTTAEAYDRLKLRPRVLVDVAKRSTACSVLGRSQAMPVAIAPTGAAGLVWFKGDLTLARAAAAMRVPFTLATRSMSSIESIAEAGGTLWFQLYPSPDERLSLDLLERARKADYHALMVTVDTPILPRRDYNRRNGFAIPFSPSVQGLARSRAPSGVASAGARPHTSETAACRASRTCRAGRASPKGRPPPRCCRAA